MKGEDDITGMLQRARAGDAGARDAAVAALYRELSRLARSRLSAESTITNLDATALVHECYIRLAEGAPGNWENRHAFFNYAAAAMRNVIVDVAREHKAQKRGGGLREITLTTGVASEAFAPDEIEHLEEALLALGKVDAQLLQIVELRYFAGLTIEDVAQQLELSARTVKRRWESARAFLFKKLRS